MVTVINTWLRLGDNQESCFKRTHVDCQLEPGNEQLSPMLKSDVLVKVELLFIQFGSLVQGFPNYGLGPHRIIK